MSRPLAGSMPSQWSPLIPPVPVGKPLSWLSRFVLKLYASIPSSLQIKGAKIAVNIRRHTKTPPAKATLSFLRRRQARARSDRPAMAACVVGASVMTPTSSLSTLPLKFDISDASPLPGHHDYRARRTPLTG